MLHPEIGLSAPITPPLDHYVVRSSLSSSSMPEPQTPPRLHEQGQLPQRRPPTPFPLVGQPQTPPELLGLPSSSSGQLPQLVQPQTPPEVIGTWTSPSDAMIDLATHTEHFQSGGDRASELVPVNPGTTPPGSPPSTSSPEGPDEPDEEQQGRGTHSASTCAARTRTRSARRM